MNMCAVCGSKNVTEEVRPDKFDCDLDVTDSTFITCADCGEESLEMTDPKSSLRSSPALAIRNRCLAGRPG